MAAEAAAAADLAPAPGWRSRLWTWWLHSVFQKTWMRLAVQAGVSTLITMCIFSTPAVWNLHSFDPILANPVLILVLGNLGLLFTANTGLPAAKIGAEGVVGGVAGGGAVYAVVYLSHAIMGSFHPGVPKAALYIILGAVLLMLTTASRYRWPQHIGLAAVFCNLTIAVGLAVCYNLTSRVWRFVLYWWWFIGLGTALMVAVATLVLPLPTGWTVRKQLARALRQEGAVLEAIVALMTADDEHAPGETLQPVLGCSAKPAATAVSGAGSSADDGDAADDSEEDFPEVKPPVWEALLARLGRLGARGGRTLSRISSRLSLRGSRANLRAEAQAMGIHPDMWEAVEPIYKMSGPTSTSMQVAWAHMRHTHLELDLYRPTRRFPLLPFRRLLLLARTLLSAAMMMLFSAQSGRPRLGPSREHAAHLRRTAAELKRCCQCLAAVLRINAPVGPAIEQLAIMEQAFLELQQAAGAAGASATQTDGQAGQAAAMQAAEQLIRTVVASAEAAEAAHGSEASSWAASAGAQPTPQPWEELSSTLAHVAGAELAQDSLALHLSLSMLFACCTRVRAMYLLLPQVVARDQEGVGDAVAAHFAAAHAWHAALHARSRFEEQAQGEGAGDVFRRSQLMWGSGWQHGSLPSSRSAAALEALTQPAVEVATPAEPAQPAGHRAGLVHSAFAAVQRWTGFTPNQTSLGLQMAVAFAAVMFLVVVPAVDAALSHRSVWAVFIIVVVHEPLLGSVIWKCVLRFGGTLLAALLGLGALYFSVLCNHLSFENHPPKFVAMTVALTVLTMPLAAGCARFGLHNAYFWIVSCLLMYTVALPGYTHDQPMPVLALWRVACTSLGIAVELLAAVLVFPVTARSAAHAATAGALRGMADVADLAFRTVLPGPEGSPARKAGSQAEAGSPCKAGLPVERQQRAPQGALDSGRSSFEHCGKPPAVPPTLADSVEELAVTEVEPEDGGAPCSGWGHATVVPQPQDGKQEQDGQQADGKEQDVMAMQQQQQQPQQQQDQEQHVAVTCSPDAGWRCGEVAMGPVLSRIYQPMMEAYGRTATLRSLLVPLRVEYHPFKQPSRFPTGPGRRALRLSRRMLNVLTTFAITMDSHHTKSVSLLEPHAAELEGLIRQLREALRALAAMVEGTVVLESAARTVAALEAHAQHLMLRVLLSGPPEGLSTADATHSLAFLAMLFNVSSVARLLCVALGEAFCPADAEGQAAAAAVLRDGARWASDAKLMAVANELVSEALERPEWER